MEENVVLFIFSISVLLFVCTVCAGSPDEDILISKNTYGNYRTSIDGDNIVWMSLYDSYDEYPVAGNAKYRIIVRNITSGEETQIPVNSSRPDNPEISGRYVVWSDSVPGGSTGYDIWYYDLETGITKTATTEYGDQRCPLIAGDIIIWNELSGPGREFAKKSVFNITERSLLYLSFDSMIPSGAVTDGGRILFVVPEESSFRLYLYDPIPKERTPVYENSGYLWDLAIFGDNAAWIEYELNGVLSTNYSIRFLNLSSGYIDNFSSGSVWIHDLRIDENLAVFTYGDYEGPYNKNGSDIWYHDYNLHKTAPLTERYGSQYAPSVSAGKITFFDNYHKTSGIYLRYYNTSSGVPAPRAGEDGNLSTESVNVAETPGFGQVTVFMGLIMVILVGCCRKK